jgi:hypothetical protein
MRIRILVMALVFVGGMLLGQNLPIPMKVRAQENPRVYVYHVGTQFATNVRGEPIGFSCVPTATGQALCHVLTVEH